MASIQYNEIYSRFYAKVQAYDIAQYPEERQNALAYDWIHSVIGKPWVYRVFSSISADDEIQELSYVLNAPLSADIDKEFVIDVIAYGMIEAQVEPQLYTPLNTRQLFGDSHEKFFSQSAHATVLQSMLSDAEAKQKRLISGRSAYHNSYLEET